METRVWRVTEMPELEKLLQLREELRQEFLDDMLPFWTKYVLDEKNGGFVGRVTWDNKKVYDADKGGILNARLLWTFSAAYKEFKLPELEEAAHRAFDYFSEYFIDKEYGGFFWMIDSEGKVVDSKKHIYTQVFGIYGLIEYYSAFKKEEALKIAKEIYQLIESSATDKRFGGYFEAYNREWKLNDDARLSEKDENWPKSMNTHLHVLEAYTNFYRHVPFEELKQKLTDLVNYFCDHILNEDKNSLVNFFDEDWTPRSALVSYGHDVEASWLIVEAAEVLKDKQLIRKTRKYAVQICDSVLETAVDPDGGIINERNGEEISDPNKDWWPQAEAIVGFLNAYQISEEEKYLNAALQSWKFIKEFILDKEYGEWYEKVHRDGTPYKMDKVRSWKAPYHNGRAVFEVSQRVKKIRKKDSSAVEAE
jgi:mannobiose 2-epimerase